MKANEIAAAAVAESAMRRHGRRVPTSASPLSPSWAGVHCRRQYFELGRRAFPSYRPILTSSEEISTLFDCRYRGYYQLTPTVETAMSNDRRRLLGMFSVLASVTLLCRPLSAQAASSPDALLAANKTLDETISRLDIAGLTALSLNEPHVYAIHPNAREITSGPEAVQKSWQAVAERFADLSVKLENPRAVVRDNVGWVSGVEVVTGKRKTGEQVTYSALTTNIFELRNGRWLLSAHLTSRVPA